MGAIIHTINPRLFQDQLTYIVNHAADRYVFFDLTFASLVEKLVPTCKGVDGWIAMTDRAHMPTAAIPNLLCYEDLLGAEGDDYDWPNSTRTPHRGFATRRARPAIPKASCSRIARRSCTRWRYACPTPRVTRKKRRLADRPDVPRQCMGIPYSAPMVGAKLVFPGCGLDGKSLYEMFENEGVDSSAGVPTVWLG